MYFNKWVDGNQIAMPIPLYEGSVDYDDGTETSVKQLAEDVTVFLKWAAEPELEERKNSASGVSLDEEAAQMIRWQSVFSASSKIVTTVDEMLHHIKAVTRAKPNCLVVGDMPYMSYHISLEDTLRNAGRFIQEGKGDAVKIEGGEKRVEIIEKLIDSEIPVMGHLGLTPQSKNIMGGYKVQGKSLQVAEQLLNDAVAIQKAGCISVVLEGIPSVVADVITKTLEIPTIGIGAGIEVDGQVLVLHDLLGMKSQEYIDA